MYFKLLTSVAVRWKNKLIYFPESLPRSKPCSPREPVSLNRTPAQCSPPTCCSPLWENPPKCTTMCTTVYHLWENQPPGFSSQNVPICILYEMLPNFCANNLSTSVLLRPESRYYIIQNKSNKTKNDFFFKLMMT